MVTRPTSDRVREALFSMLLADGLLGDLGDEGSDGDEDEGSDGDGAGPAEGPRVLDLYAGSGALAFEALSRGASEAVLVEQNREATAAIRENARALGTTEHIRLLDTKVERALGRLEGPFGLVFLDPPYADVRAAPFAGILEKAARLLAPGGALILEHASSDAPPAIAGLDLDRSRRHGDTTLTLYRVPNPP